MPALCARLVFPTRRTLLFVVGVAGTVHEMPCGGRLLRLGVVCSRSPTAATSGVRTARPLRARRGHRAAAHHQRPPRHAGGPPAVQGAGSPDRVRVARRRDAGKLPRAPRRRRLRPLPPAAGRPGHRRAPPGVGDHDVFVPQPGRLRRLRRLVRRHADRLAGAGRAPRGGALRRLAAAFRDAVRGTRAPDDRRALRPERTPPVDDDGRLRLLPVRAEAPLPLPALARLSGRCAACAKASECLGGCTAAAVSTTGSPAETRFCVRQLETDEMLALRDTCR